MRIAAVALMSAAALVLTGCTPAPHATSSPRPTATPVFTTDAEAWAAAEKAYRAYRRAAEKVLSDGGVDSQYVNHYATGRLLIEEKEGDAEFREKGYRSVGNSKIVSFDLQRADLTAPPDSKDVVGAYVCLDVSGVDVRNSDGQSVIDQSRPPHVSYVIDFDLRDRALLPSRQEPWKSAGACD